MVRPALVISVHATLLSACVSVQLPELPASHPANPTAPSAPLVIRTQIEPYRAPNEEQSSAAMQGMPGMQHGVPSAAPPSPATTTGPAAPAATDHAAMGHAQANRPTVPGRSAALPAAQGHAGHAGAAGARQPAQQPDAAQDRRGTGGHAAHAHTDGPSAAGLAADAAKGSRTVRVTARDAMRFEPASVTVGRGETVRFVVTNAGKLPHEFMLGDPQEQQAHEAMMQRMPGMKHDDASTLSLAPGQTKSLVWTFSKEGRYEAGCHVPGHYPAGMRMAVSVVASAGGK
jgi:uncharacterized cupredoxin-like copper-binding protein